MVDALSDDRSRTFHIVEQFYYQRWRKQASQSQLQQMDQLVENGQIEFLMGGLVMQVFFFSKKLFYYFIL